MTVIAKDAIVADESSLSGLALANGTKTPLRVDNEGALYVHQADTDARIDSITLCDNIVVYSAEITRPSGTTPDYSIGDVISNGAGDNFVFTGVNKKVDYVDSVGTPQTIYKGGYILEAMIYSDQAITSDQEFLVQIYSAAQTITDNAAFVPTYAMKDNLITEFMIKAPIYSVREEKKLSKAFNGAFENMYAVVMVNKPLTPVSLSKWKLKLTVSRNP